jgi:dipeptidase E
MSLRLYLSSQGLGSNPERNRPADANSNKALIVVNALDAYAHSRTSALQYEIHTLRALGYVCQELDLRDYFHPENDHQSKDNAEDAQLTALLTRVNLIWVIGGNTFVLAKAMTQAGFKAALLQANEDRIAQRLPALMYAGYSAGAVVAGIDLQGIQLMDDPAVNPAGYDPTTEALTLGLIDDRIIPHYQSDNPESEQADRAVDFLEQRKLKYRTLSDGEVWLNYSP